MAFPLVNFTSCSKDILVLKYANEVPYDVIYSTKSVKEKYLRNNKTLQLCLI